jgi:hypothetical protein
MIDPKDPAAAVVELAKAVDQLNGQVAALMAYIAYTSALLPDESLPAAQQTAQGLAAPSLLPGGGDNGPASSASQGVATVRATAKQLLPR